jgi:Na+/phosphate symporter
VLGTVPEAVFKNLMTKYEAERMEKQSLVQELKKHLADTAQDERDIEQYLQSIKKYVAIEQLDREMLLELIKYIEIGERKVVDGQKCRDIVIHYNLVDKAG